jgi:diaminohydroxyphosphoribosylaminopyrimidine deaminase/5-amino-6-(5-phosphoribosylamino)uracil reductase
LARRSGDAVSLDAVDRIYLRRAYELAERGRGSTAPNPCVGAVVMRGTTTLGEGYHRARGEPHAEIEALRAAAATGADVRGATLYVSLEPCDHTGSTPPCSRTILESGVTRVVVGTLDLNPAAAGGAARLQAAGLSIDVADDPAARAIVEDFTTAIARSRPYLTLKMAASLDGFVAAQAGPSWLTGERARDFVRDLRIAHDAVMVGAGTVRIDDPQLTVRPPAARRRPYVRIVACEDAPVPVESRVFTPVDGYSPTVVLAPAGLRDRFAALESVADVHYVGHSDSLELDLTAALEALKARGMCSVLCEGGPTLAARLLMHDLVDRLHWLIAPLLLGNERAVPALAHTDVASVARALRFDRVERLGDDLLVSARSAEGN